MDCRGRTARQIRVLEVEPETTYIMKDVLYLIFGGLPQLGYTYLLLHTGAHKKRLDENRKPKRAKQVRIHGASDLRHPQTPDQNGLGTFGGAKKDLFLYFRDYVT